MPKVLIVYYSKTGNTRKMAEAIAQGAKSMQGVEVTLRECTTATNDDLLAADCIVLGSPTYFRLVAWPLKKFIDESVTIYRRLRGKKGGMFTSTGTADTGEVCLQSLGDMLDEHGIDVVSDGILVVNEPKPKDLEACRSYGKELAMSVRKS